MTQHVFITGGSSGIGLAIAQSFAEAGYKTTISGRNEARLKAADLDYVIMDVTKPASVERGFEAIDDVDILICNAGNAQTAPIHKTDLALWQHMINVNLTGAFLCVQQALPAMIKKKAGRIIIVASTASLKAYKYTMAYTAAKHGVLGLMRSVALEIATKGVTCNAICPGFTDTPMIRGSINAIIKKTGRPEADIVAEFSKDNPMKRLIAPEEVADAALWLAGPAASSVNGQSIVIDGGEVIS